MILLIFTLLLFLNTMKIMLNMPPLHKATSLIKPFKEGHSLNTRGARTYDLNIPKMKTSFYGSRSVQVKSVKDWNDTIDKINFTTEHFIIILDSLSYYLSALILKHNTCQLYQIIVTFCPFCPFGFLFCVCLSTLSLCFFVFSLPRS